MIFSVDDGLREPGKFIFELEDRLEQGTVVVIHGKVLWPRPDGVTYVLSAKPAGWPGCFTWVRCAGPRYSPPIRAFLHRIRERNVQKEIGF